MNANTPILTWLKNRPFGLKQRVRTWAWPRVRWKQWRLYAPDTIAFLRLRLFTVMALSRLHSLLDSGSLANMFDGDTFTLGRVMEANPARLEFTFPEPWEIAGMAADFGTMDFRWKISLYGEGESEPIIYEQTYFFF